MEIWFWLVLVAGSVSWAARERRENTLLRATVKQEQTEISQQQNTQEQIRLNEARFKAILETSVDVMTRLDLDGVILELYTRPGFYQTPPDRRLVGKKIDSIYETSVTDRYQQAMEQVLLTGRPQRFTYEGEYHGRAYGREVWLTGCGEELIAIERDTTERVMMAKQLRYLNLYDSLTGLFNRSRFEQEMRHFGEDEQCSVGIVVCDLDGLKLINDTLGHEQGDRQLVDVADLFKRCFRAEDHIARIGGDEFAAILPNVDDETLTAICRKISQEVDEYNLLLPNARLGLSIGHAMRGCPTDMNTLFIEAENEMYRQKQLRDENVRQFILDGMFQSVEARDYFKSGHPQRVEEYAVKLAAVLELSSEQVENLHLLSRYHDIGNVGLDERIVMKPGRLTTDERQEIAQHCEIGCRIARCVPALVPVADLVLKHHEQWDGSGYPLGLQHTDIPLECRILAIADAYEAMTAGRPYRHALSKTEAIEELRRGAGTQFDPELLKLFLQVLESEHE
ncbi:hypothetical protein AXX12_17435 [Anaerosporomusa subterranea]|uniref:Diguanylate cyclase n=1 Tax=Anaerosporomusa subterranea TaxID=1794912 RepID=A0A154BUZ2_ANASB|nr:HD domain-containing phosphohydrolase [Anaerosporomusa subterranea]KYZ77843.1 hypothetical protein AXX12_17435 [Anaerosporomusa subterranea]